MDTYWYLEQVYFRYREKLTVETKKFRNPNPPGEPQTT